MRTIFIITLAAILVGCASAQLEVTEGKKLVIDGAIYVEKPTNKTGDPLKVPGVPDFDNLKKMKDDLQSELARHCFKIAKTNSRKFILKPQLLRWHSSFNWLSMANC